MTSTALERNEQGAEKDSLLPLQVSGSKTRLKVTLIQFGEVRDTAAVVAALSSQHLRPATKDELHAFAEQHANARRFWVVALGDGRRDAVCMREYPGRIFVDSWYKASWPTATRFLAVATKH